MHIALEILRGTAPFVLIIWVIVLARQLRAARRKYAGLLDGLLADNTLDLAFEFARINGHMAMLSPAGELSDEHIRREERLQHRRWMRGIIVTAISWAGEAAQKQAPAPPPPPKRERP